MLNRVSLPTGYGGGQATAVNDSGVIAGTLDPRDYSRPTKGFVWSAGRLRIVHGFTPGGSLRVTGIDAVGRVYGASFTAAKQWHAIRVDPDGRTYDFGLLPGGTFSEIASASARGDVVGRANGAPTSTGFETFRAVVAHPKGTLLLLPSLGRPGKESDEATAINDQGDAVGKSRPAGAHNDVPVLWRCVFGQAQHP